MSLFDQWFRAKEDEYKQAAPYRGLRQQLLKLDPKAVGISESPERPVYAYLLEMGYPQAVATLVIVGDGTVSLYFSNGGGMIGLGEDEAVKKAAGELLDGVRYFLPHCLATTEFPLPKKGNARFYLLTFGGTRTAEALEDDLVHGRLPLSPLFLKSHQVIALVREAHDRR